ncbi:MAG: glycosyltransferase family 2 protein [Deltaproteobacteria bacterium]|nr:glycosyltransferase family 2 protein [Deltaproteobacteria bacterium]
MYKDKSICVVVPAYNEATQIGKVIETMPDYVDEVFIVDDASKDKTVEIVKRYQKKSKKIKLIEHKVNQGVGGAITTGYKRARDNDIDVTAVMAGDGQMDPDDLEKIIEPVASGSADYSKGNRLFYGDAWSMIPHIRYMGNSFLSLMTKVASGYWHIADSQSGYTAISLTALKRIDLDGIYKDYGMPNDLLIKLNQFDFKVRDVHIKPVYNIGEKSGIRLMKVVPKISWLLCKGFWRRLFFKYVIKDFHPLVFFYALSFILLGISIPLIMRLFYIWAMRGDIPDINAMALIFTLVSGLQTLFFGMWFDMEYNKKLK